MSTSKKPKNRKKSKTRKTTKYPKYVSRIKYAAIHPSIGFARIGNSENEYFLAPEVPYPAPTPDGHNRDAEQKIKNVEILWEVHVANKKSAWYTNNYPMDIPEAAPVKLRNKNIGTEDRHKLMIDPGLRSIKGNNEKDKPEYKFDSGAFMGEKVYLGELQTDEVGRLIFLGGHGVAKSIYSGNFVAGVGNQDGWYDDISDGPVKAYVTIGKRVVSVKPAWVVTAPVNFAPDFKDVVTLWDCMRDAFVQGTIMDFPKKISFVDDIYPIFQRLSSYSWLNEGFNNAFGHHAPYNFENPDLIDRLSRTDDLFQETRRQIFRRFRDPSATIPIWDKWPWNYGDGIKEPPTTSPKQYFSITPTQYKILQKWVDGEFINDWKERNKLFKSELKDFPLSQQPSVLDKTSLDNALGGPFRPGVELTWPMRIVTMYSEPFRVRVRDDNNPDQSYGPILSPKEALALGGPLYYNSPGDLTRWMSTPWQLDLAACRYAYFGEDPYLPTFWAARAPNQVLTNNQYAIVMDTSKSLDERLNAFYHRTAWYRYLYGGTFMQMNQMITEYVKQGFIEKRKGITDDPNFPEVMYVEEADKFIRDLEPAYEKNNFDFSKILDYFNSLFDG